MRMTEQQQITWDELIPLDCTTHSRTWRRVEDMEQNYIDHRARLAARNISLDQYINENVLCNELFKLCTNLFPYDLEKGIAHHVFWMRSGAKISMQEAKKIVAEECASDTEIIVLENPYLAMSVPTVPHYQIFLRHLSEVAK